jgi:hypothetical protein
MQLSIGFALIGIGAVITALMCLTCFCIVKMARGIAGGRQQRPQNPIGGTLYDVSAKCDLRLLHCAQTDACTPPDSVFPHRVRVARPLLVRCCIFTFMSEGSPQWLGQQCYLVTAHLLLLLA